MNRSRATSTVLGFAENGDANRPINGLQVLDGKSLSLVGSDVNFDGGKLFAPGGRVELGGLTEAGTVGLGVDGDILSLSFPDGVERGDVSLGNESRVNTLAGGGGSITVNARNVDVSGRSRINTGIAEGLGTFGSQAGDIEINAVSLNLKDLAVIDASTSGNGNAGNVTLNIKNNVLLTDSGIVSKVKVGGVGNSGDISINSTNLTLRDAAQIQTLTNGQGNAGKVIINAKDSVLFADGQTTVLSNVEAGGVGQGGDIDINSETLTLRDGAQLVTATRRASDTQKAGKGDSGNINIKVTDIIKISGKVETFASGIFSNVDIGAEGDGGDINIDAGSFNLINDAQVAASTLGKGNAGNVMLTVQDRIFISDRSTILSTVESGGEGKGGNINIDAINLSIENGAQLSTIARGASDIQAAGKGDAGNINIKVSGTVNIVGENVFSSGLFSQIQAGTEGKGGDINIDATFLNLGEGAQINASTFGKGDAGKVTVKVRDASLISGDIFSTVGSGGIGKGGNIDINSVTLSLKDGAQLVTITRDASDTGLAGKGDAGSVNIKVSGIVDITGKRGTSTSGIRSLVEKGTEGSGGNITVYAGSFNLREGAELAASTFGKGNAGNITITAIETISLRDGKGGNININAENLLMRDGASLQTSTRAASDTQTAGKGNAGNMNIKVIGNIDIAGMKDGSVTAISSFVDRGTEGNGGDINIDAGSFKLQDGAFLFAPTLGQGDAGYIKITARDFVKISGKNDFAGGCLFVKSTSKTGTTGDIIISSPKITLDDGGTLNAESTSGNGGNISLLSDLLLIRRGAQISTNAGTAQQGGDGGNIDINSKIIVAVPEENSDITANAFEGKGGNIDIDTQAIFGIEPASANVPERNDITASSELGITGNINLNAPDNSSIQNSLTDLQQNPIDTNALIANSCIARSRQQESTFNITGAGGLPQRPGHTAASDYSTGEVQNLSDKIQSAEWKPGEPFLEPQGVYELPSGKLILSRECS